MGRDTREHVEECCAGEDEGVAFRAWKGPHGAKGDVLRAVASIDEVVAKDHLVQAVYRLWSMSPCSLPIRGGATRLVVFDARVPRYVVGCGAYGRGEPHLCFRCQC